MTHARMTERVGFPSVTPHQYLCVTIPPRLLDVRGGGRYSVAGNSTPIIERKTLMADSKVLVRSTAVATALTAAIRQQDIPALVNELLEREYFQGELECWVDDIICEDAEAALANLKQVDSAEAFHQWFSSLFVEFAVDREKWGGELDADVFKIIFALVAERCGIEWPSFCVVYFDNLDHASLYVGEVETGKIYFAFEADECFSRVLTDKGKSLQEVAGEALSVTVYGHYTPEY